MKKLNAALMATAMASGLALAGCATVEEAVVEATTETYNAELTGAQETAPGDPDGMAKFEVSISDNLDSICYELKDVQNIGPITAAHIHRGAPGTDGPPVLTLKEANEGGYKGCTGRSEWLEDSIEKNFSAYYVNVHTAEYPNGAIRGQLHK